MTEERKQEIEDLVWEILGENELDGYNSDVSWMGDGEITLNAAAPNGSTICVNVYDLSDDMSNKEIMQYITKELSLRAYDFDPEELFNELWHPGFEYSAFEFVEILKEDAAFFKDFSAKY